MSKKKASKKYKPSAEIKRAIALIEGFARESTEYMEEECANLRPDEAAVHQGDAVMARFIARQLRAGVHLGRRETFE